MKVFDGVLQLRKRQMQPNVVEIVLTSGQRILLERDWDKVYGVREDQYCRFRFVPCFPFLKVEKRTCTSFRFRSHYETLNSYLDPKYRVDCSIRQLAALFGASITPFEMTCINEDLL